MFMTKAWSHHSYLRARIENVLIINLPAYIHKVEHLLEEEAKQLTRKVEDEAKWLDDEGRITVYNAYYGDFLHMEQIFPQFHRRSMLVSIYSLFEYSLDAICREGALLRHCNNTLEDLPGKVKGIYRSKLYLKRVLKIKLSWCNEHWRNIQIYGQIRNIITHNGGVLDKINENVEDYIKRNDILDHDNENILIINNGFLLIVVDDIVNFLKWLFESMPEFS